MIQRVLIATILLTIFVSPIEAAPPREGVATLEQRVQAGCKYAGLVFVAQVLNLREVVQAGQVLQTADLKLAELLKGTASQVQKTISDFKKPPGLTDSLKEDLEDRMTYLMFLSAPAASGWDTRIAGLAFDGQQDKRTDKEFRSAVSMAKAACRQ